MLEEIPAAGMGVTRAIVAVAACTLPRAVWVRWSDRLPVYPMALASALIPLGTGLVYGVIGYLEFAVDAAARTNVALLQIADSQVEGVGAGVDASVGMSTALTMLAAITFAFFTKTGIACTYLCLSGLYRVLSSVANEPRGDPILSLVYAVATRGKVKTVVRAARREHERRAGPEVPDRLLAGGGADFPEADLVLVASRRKPEWTPGTVLLTSQGCFKVGVAIERDLREGLRTCYPLVESGHGEVLRRVVRCELPPIRGPILEKIPTEA